MKPNALGYSIFFSWMTKIMLTRKKMKRKKEVLLLPLCSWLYYFTSDRRQLSKKLFPPKFSVPVAPLCQGNAHRDGKSLTQSLCTVRKICNQKSITGTHTKTQAWIISTKQKRLKSILADYYSRSSKKDKNSTQISLFSCSIPAITVKIKHISKREGL